MPPATASASTAKAREQLLSLLRPLVADAGYDLDDVVISSAGRRSLVRVTVDADGGIDLDAVAVVSRLVSDALDEHGDEVLHGAYVLEVSSPGVDRPLTELRHWRRATGRLVSTHIAGRAVTGRVRHVDDRQVTFDVDGTERTAAWTELGRGKVQVEFSRADNEPSEED